MSVSTEGDLAAAAKTLETIEVLVRRLRKQLGDPQPAARRRRRKITLREAALRSLREDEWLSLTEWEAALLRHGYEPPRDPKRPDQTRRSLASLAARNRHLVDADGRGNYRLAPPDDSDPLF